MLIIVRLVLTKIFHFTIATANYKYFEHFTYKKKIASLSFIKERCDDS